MLRKLGKKQISNVLFILVLGMMLYPPTREWFMRQIAFAPSIENVDSSRHIENFNWNLRGLNTDAINFSDLKGKVIFVNFWATWCPPCRAEMPTIQELYDKYNDQISFVFVTNENWTTVASYFEKNAYDLPVYNSIGMPPKIFTETSSIPATYLISKQGEIRISKVGAANWNSNKVHKLIDDLLKE